VVGGFTGLWPNEFLQRTAREVRIVPPSRPSRRGWTNIFSVLSDTPSVPAKEASHFLLYGAAIPPRRASIYLSNHRSISRVAAAFL